MEEHIPKESVLEFDRSLFKEQKQSFVTSSATSPQSSLVSLVINPISLLRYEKETLLLFTMS